jgi:Leucine-rich repeat (LRR) protein
MLSTDGSIYSIGNIIGTEFFPEDDTPPEIENQNALILKHSPSGDLEFSTSFGAELFPDDAVKILPDGNGTIVVGTTANVMDEENHGYYDIFVTRFDENGTELWTDYYGTSGRDFVEDAILDSKGNIYIAGASDGNFSTPDASVSSDEWNGDYTHFIIRVDENITHFIDFPETFYHDTTISLKIDESNGTEIYAMRYSEPFAVLDENLTQFEITDNSISDFEDFDFVEHNETTKILYVLKYGDLYQYYLEDVSSSGKTLSGAMSINPNGNGFDSYNSRVVAGDDGVYVLGQEYSSNLPFVSKIDEDMNIVSLQYFENDENLSVYFKDAVFDRNSLVVSGILEEYDEDEYRSYPYGVFRATVSDRVVEVSVQDGWGLFSGNIDKEDLPDEVLIVYAYEEKDKSSCEANPSNGWACEKVWKVYSPDEELNQNLQNLVGLEEIEEITNDMGIWILADGNFSISPDYNDENISVESYGEGWSLNGIGVDTNSSHVRCNYDNNKSLASWKFDRNHNGWEVQSEDSTFYPTISRFDTIEANSGFWTNCQFEPFEGFQDIELQKCVNRALGEDENRVVIPESELLSLENLECNSTGVTDLEGITRLYYLEKLNVSSTALSDISHLEKMEKLEDLNISSTSITNIEPLFGMERLEKLDVSGTAIASDSEAQRDLNESLPHHEIHLIH